MQNFNKSISESRDAEFRGNSSDKDDRVDMGSDGFQQTSYKLWMCGELKMHGIIENLSIKIIKFADCITWFIEGHVNELLPQLTIILLFAKFYCSRDVTIVGDD